MTRREECPKGDADRENRSQDSLCLPARWGIGPADCFSISDKTSNWVDFLGTDLTKLPVVKPYISTKVRLMFDPPTSSAVIDEMNKLINEYEWRLTITVPPTPDPVTVKESEDYNGE